MIDHPNRARAEAESRARADALGVAIRSVNSGEIVLTMNREQAQACYDALMTEPLRDYSPQECAECFLIVQLADALGHPVIKPIRDRADVCS